MNAVVSVREIGKGRALKITIVLGPFQALPPVGYGAVEKVWYEFAKEFSSLGHSVILIGKCETVEDISRDSSGVQIVPLRGFSATGRLWVDLLKDFLYALDVRQQIEPSDIIVTNTFWTPTLLSLSARHLGRIVVHVARFPKGQMWLYRGADALQAISSAVAREIVRQSPSLQTKVRVLPYPVDLQTYHPPNVARRYDGDLTVLYAGRIHPEKGVDLLVASFHQVLLHAPKARLRIVGPSAIERGGGGGIYLNGLKKAASGLPVDFIGPIGDPASLALEYQNAHCFCYPSLAEKGEAFGLAALEAMAAGLPVVVSDLACFRDYIEPGHNGLIFDHRAAESRLALGMLLGQTLADEDFAIQLGRNAAKKANEFALKTVAQRYLEMFSVILGH